MLRERERERESEREKSIVNNFIDNWHRIQSTIYICAEQSLIGRTFNIHWNMC